MHHGTHRDPFAFADQAGWEEFARPEPAASQGGRRLGRVAVLDTAISAHLTLPDRSAGNRMLRRISRVLGVELTVFEFLVVLGTLAAVYACTRVTGLLAARVVRTVFSRRGNS